MLAVLALLVPVALSWASTVVSYTAVGQTMVNGQSGVEPERGLARLESRLPADRQLLRIAYLNAGGTFQGPVHSNAGSNPFVDGTPAFFARAWCRNGSGGTVSSVTCQTTTP